MMKAGNSSVKSVVQVLVIASAILGVYIANKTYHYEVLVRGIIGLVMMYQIYRTLWSSSSRDNDVPFLFAKNLKYVFLTFFYSIIFYWSIQQVIEMILFLIKLI
jgi:apolipoprotein N-acyltransferase